MAYMVPTSSQDEALARYGVSREVPGSVLKCEMVPDSFHASPKVPHTPVSLEGNTEGSVSTSSEPLLPSMSCL